MSNNIRSIQYNALKLRAVDAICTMKRLDQELTAIEAEEAKLGINLGNTMTELEHMQKLSEFCIEAEYDLLKQEELAEINNAKVQPRQNWLGRKLTQVAQLVG